MTDLKWSGKILENRGSQPKNGTFCFGDCNIAKIASWSCVNTPVYYLLDFLKNYDFCYALIQPLKMFYIFLKFPNSSISLKGWIISMSFLSRDMCISRLNQEKQVLLTSPGQCFLSRHHADFTNVGRQHILAEKKNFKQNPAGCINTGGGRILGPINSFGSEAKKWNSLWYKDQKVFSWDLP